MNKLKQFYEKNERLLSGAALLFGFLGDILTLNRIDLWYENLVIISYLILAGVVILFLSRSERFSFFPLLLQISFGALFSAFIVLYSKSADFIASWPFIAILIILFAGNEIFKEKYARLVWRVTIYFIAIYAYAAAILPVLLRKIGDSIFVISGILSLILIFLYILCLRVVMPEEIKKSARKLTLGILGSFIIFNILYFTNIIPPLPLTLKDVELAHKVSRNSTGQYEVETEPRAWWTYVVKTEPIFHRFNNEPVYIYSAVFAPIKINTAIFHKWQYFDEVKNQWIESSVLKYNMTGGRSGGYHGYTFKNNLKTGRWRVAVTTESGQVLGRTNFKIEQVSSPAILKIEFK